MLENVDWIRHELSSDKRRFLNINEVYFLAWEINNALRWNQLATDSEFSDFLSLAWWEIPPIVRQISTEIVEKNLPILDMTKNLPLDFSSNNYLKIFIESSRQKMEMVRKKNPSVSHLTLNNQEWYIRNKYINFLRLAWIIDEANYDILYKENMYAFMESEVNTHFSREVTLYRNWPTWDVKIIEDKDVLTIWPWSGRDEFYFLRNWAKSISTIDLSSYVISSLKNKAMNLKPELGRRFDVQPPNDMISALKEINEKWKQFDTIYWHSVFHYFDNEELKNLFKLALWWLREWGHLAFAIKAPWVNFDWNWICLVREERAMFEWDLEDKYVKKRWFLTNDWLIRFFRDGYEFKSILPWVKNDWFKFNQRYKSDFTIEWYESPDWNPQEFYYFIFKKEKIKD